MNLNPNHVYAVTASATAVSWVADLNSLLHMMASVVVIVSGLIAIWTYLRDLRAKKQALVNSTNQSK